MKKTKLVLFGTPEFAANSFRALIESGNYEIPLIVTQPDKEVGRGLTVNYSPVKKLALEKEILATQPFSLKGITKTSTSLETKNEKNKELVEVLNSISPVDLFVVIAYGKIIPLSLLQYPKLTAINIHGSLLPRWRGAAPIHRALAAGDTETGVGIMKLEEGLDTGAVYSEAKTPILPEDDFLSLHNRLSDLGKNLLLETIPRIISSGLTPVVQDENGITHADKWDKSDLEIKWEEPASITINRIRASSPFPGARTQLNGNLVKVFKASEYTKLHSGLPAGSVVEITDQGAVVQLSGAERLLITELQLSGKKRMPAVEVARGRGIKVQDRFLK